MQWHDDPLEVSNPGSFPEGVRLDNLLVTRPRPRNPLLVNAFKRAGIVERTGRGIDTIFSEQLRNGRPAPSYARSTETGVVLVLPGGEANLESARLAAGENREGRPLTLDDLLLLNHLWLERQAVTADVAVLLQKPEADVRVRADSAGADGAVPRVCLSRAISGSPREASYAQMGWYHYSR